MLTVKVTADMAGVTKKVGKWSKDSGLGNFASMTLARMMRPFIPERDSILINKFSVKPWELSYTAPYAKPMYYGVVKGTQVKYHKSTATSKWDKHINKADFAKQLEGYIKRVG